MRNTHEQNLADLTERIRRMLVTTVMSLPVVAALLLPAASVFPALHHPAGPKQSAASVCGTAYFLDV